MRRIQAADRCALPLTRRARASAQVVDPIVEDDEPDGDHHLDHLHQREDQPARTPPRPERGLRADWPASRLLALCIVVVAWQPNASELALSTPILSRSEQKPEEGVRHKIKLSVYIYELPTWLNLARGNRPGCGARRRSLDTPMPSASRSVCCRLIFLA